MQVRRPLVLTLGALALVAAVLPAAIAGVVLARINVDAVRNDAKVILDQALLDAAHTVERHFGHAAEGLTLIAQVFTDRALPGEARLATARALVSTNPALAAVGVYDREGALIDVIVEDGVSADVPARFDDALWLRVNRGGVVADASRARDGRVEVFVATRIAAGGATTGAVGAWVSFDAVQAALKRTSELAFGGRAHSIFVVDGSDHVVADVPPPRALNKTSEPLVAQVRESNGAAHIVDDRPASDVTAAAQAVEGIAGKDGAFIVVATLPNRVVYASVARMQRSAAVVVGVAVLAAIVGAILVARSITRPVRALVVRAQALAERRFGDVAVLDRPDELGLLGSALAGAATDLRASEEKLLAETRVREGLGRYLPGSLVDAYVHGDTRELLAGKRAEITILFADVVGFTPLSAKLPPEDLCAFLNDLFTVLTEIVFKHGGTVDKFIGDSMMAFWGAPVTQDDHATRAVEAARDMLRFLDVQNARWQKRFGVQIELAIGINTGVAVVGNLGSDKRLVYTAIGESVNIAARLETVAGPMQILTTSETKRRVADADGFVAVGEKTLKGMAAPVDVYAVEV
jgi:adenylate cyclase